MDAQTTQPPQAGLPQGYRGVPLSASMASDALRLCVVFKTDPDPVAGHWIVLRENMDSRVYLGCILDRRDRVLQWTEVWVQQVGGLSRIATARGEALTNRVLDERWVAFAEALDALPGARGIATGWETENPPPLFVRVSDGAPVHPSKADGSGRWLLCRDDSALAKAGVPTYGGSLHRYWRLDGADGAASPLVRTTDDAPAGTGAIDMAGALGEAQGVASLNPACGRILVRPYFPLGYGEFLSVLSGGAWEGVRSGRHILDPGAQAAPLHSVSHPGRLFTGPRGQPWRMIETLHLKLSAFSQALNAVGRSEALQKRPFLSLSDESFRVDLPGAESGLPFLWTARITLVDPGCAVPLPESIGVRDYYRPDGGRMTVYRPASAGSQRQTRGDLRLRGATDNTRSGVIVEGTFRPRDRLTISRRDLVWIRLGLADEAVELYGRLEQDRALAENEWRFRSVGCALSEKTRAALRAAEGVLLEDLPAEVIPLPGPACDLHAMAVLGVRTLLVNAKTTLPMAVDELISLARAADALPSQATLSERIATLWAEDERWQRALGPHRLSDSEDAGRVCACVPPAIWRETLAALIGMFPGVSSFSTCRDLADAPVGAATSIFAPAAGALEALLAKTRCLIAGDWEGNPDVQSVIGDAMAQVQGGANTGTPV